MSNEPSNYLTIGNYRISRADDRNLQVEVFKTVKAKRGKYVTEARETDKWVRRGYFSNLVSACSGVLGYMNEDAVEVSPDVKSLIAEIKQNAQVVAQAVKTADLKTSDFEK